MNLPFTGEEMECIMCQNKQLSSLIKETNWRCVQVDRELFYVCPRHFPDDDASDKQFEKAYSKVLKRIEKLRRGKPR